MSQWPALVRLMARLHVWLYQLSGGRLFGTFQGVPVLLLSTRGRKTGRRYRTPLLYGEHRGGYVVIASYGGSPQHPAWWKNLLHAPRGEVQVRARKVAVSARALEGPERDQAWDHMVGLYPPFADYQKRTERVIPVVLLEPV